MRGNISYGWCQAFQLWKKRVTLHSSHFFLFWGRDQTSLGWAKNWGEVGRGEREGGGGGEKRNRLQSIPNILPASVRSWTGSNSAIDWLLALQSKCDVRNLSFMLNPTSGTQQDQNRYGQVRRSIQRGLWIFCSGNVEIPFAKQQTHRTTHCQKEVSYHWFSYDSWHPKGVQNVWGRLLKCLELISDVSFARLTPSPCSLFFTLPPSFVPWIDGGVATNYFVVWWVLIFRRNFFPWKYCCIEDENTQTK